MEKLSYILSLLGLICFICASLLKGKRMGGILALVFWGNVLIGISYLFSDSPIGAASLFVGAAQAFVNYFFERKQKSIPVWLVVLYAAAFITAGTFTYAEPIDLLALVASLAFVMCVGQKNGKNYRIWNIVNVGLWVIYDVLKPAYPALVTNAIVLIFIITGMLIYDRKKEIGNA